MGFLDTLLAKVADLPKEYAELSQLAVQASREVLSTHVELHESHKRVRELEREVEQLRTARSLVEGMDYSEGYYFRKIGEKEYEEVPYCQNCLDNKLHRVRFGPNLACPACGAKGDLYQVDRARALLKGETPPKREDYSWSPPPPPRSKWEGF